MAKVAIHFTDGFEETEALATVDILRRAGIETFMVSITGKKEVSGAHNIKVKTEELFENINYSEIDMIILPGGPGTKDLENHSALNEKLKEFYAEEKWIAAICAAPLILGKLGFLKGKEAVSYPGFEKFLEGASIVEKKVVESSKIISSRGVGTVFDFALKIVEVLEGKERSEEVKKAILY